MGRSKENLGCQVLPSTVFETTYHGFAVLYTSVVAYELSISLLSPVTIRKSAGITDVCYYAGFIRVLRIRTQVLTLVWQALHLVIVFPEHSGFFNE